MCTCILKPVFSLAQTYHFLHFPVCCLYGLWHIIGHLWLSLRYCHLGVVKLNIGMRCCLESPSHSYPTLAWLFLAHWAFRRANLYNVTADPEPKLSLLYCFAVLTLVSFPGKALGQHKSGSKSETWSTAQWAQGYPVKHEHMSSVPSTPAKSLARCCESVILALGR